MSAAIETRGLTRFFGEFCAVDHIDIKVDRGVSYGFLGSAAPAVRPRSRCSPDCSPPAAAISVLGRDVSKPDQSLEAQDEHIGVVPEDLALFSDLTGREYLTIFDLRIGVCRVRRRSAVASTTCWA